MVTIAEQIQQKSRRINKWIEENPGLEWSNPEYPEDEGKIYLQKVLIESEVFRSLGRVSLIVYHIFLSKRFMKRVKRNGKKVWVCTNNGEIVFTYNEAGELGFSKTQFRNAIDELQGKGFIDITHLGVGGRPGADGTGDYTTFWIDDRWEDWGTEDFREPRTPRGKDMRNDRGFGAIWKDPVKRKRLLKTRASIKNNTRFSHTGIENNTRLGGY